MADEWLENMVNEILAKESELTNLKRAANTFYRAKELPAPFPDSDSDDSATSGALRIRPDEYYGRAFSTVTRAYLERRKQAVSADEILRALEQGGFDFDAVGWAEETRARTIAMSMAKNTATFHRLPNGLFGLKEWYPDAIERKKGKKSEAEKEDGKDEAASE